MRISQEVRDFAAKQSQGVEGFITTGPTGVAASKAAALKGMEEMSAKF